MRSLPRGCARDLLPEPPLVVVHHLLTGEHVAADDGALRHALAVERPVVVGLDVVLEVVDGLLLGLPVPEDGGAAFSPRLPAVHLDATTPVDGVLPVFLFRMDFERHSTSPWRQRLPDW